MLLFIAFDFLLGPVEGKATFFDQVVDQLDLLDVFSGEPAVALSIFVWFQEVELSFPVSDQRRFNSESVGHFSYGVVALELFVRFFEWHLLWFSSVDDQTIIAIFLIFALMRGLVRRAITASIFVVIMLVGLFTGPYTFGLLFFLIAALCLYEFFTLTLERGGRRRYQIRKVFGIVLGLLPSVLVFIVKLRGVPPSEEFIQLASLLFSPFVFTIFIYELYAASKQPFSNIAFLILGLFYIGLPFALVNVIAFDGDQFLYRLIFGLLLLTWVNDTGAYLVGSKFGKTPLFPSVSPNKTWEGTVGGMLTTLAFGFILGLLFEEVALISWLILALIVALFGNLGDLVESMLKRSVGVKDSGSLLPGHGGVLDRFDAFIFVIPFAAAYLLYLR